MLEDKLVKDAEIELGPALHVFGAAGGGPRFLGCRRRRHQRHLDDAPGDARKLGRVLGDAEPALLIGRDAGEGGVPQPVPAIEAAQEDGGHAEGQRLRAVVEEEKLEG